MLQLDNLSCGYGMFQAVHGLSLELRAGTFNGLIGANGAGKSSTLMCIAGHVALQEGTLRFNGQDISGLGPRERVKLGIAISPEGRRLFKDLSVEDNLKVGGLIHPAAFYAQDRDKVLALFPRLGERLDSLAGNLSGGEQQMLAVGRALLLNAHLVVMDEPSEGLAPTIVDVLVDAVHRLVGEGVAVLVVEQNLRAAVRMAGRQLVMVSGRIEAEFGGDELTTRPDLQHRYLGVGTVPAPHPRP
jgi:branched-chain amino acid transport system ATP-binding protein